jgi:penicillin-binding protein 2
MTTDITFSSATAQKRNLQTSLVAGSSSRDILFRRSLAFILFATTVLGICAYRLAELQLVQGSEHLEQAEQNRVRMVPIRSDRGNITDRDGQLLAANRLSRAVYFWPRQQSPDDWIVAVQRLSQVLGIPAEEMLGKLEEAGYDSPLPIRVAQQLSPEAFVALAEFSEQFPGVEILGESNRYYPQGAIASHILGYIGEATEADMTLNPDYPSGMIVGQMGIERSMNAQLQGTWGNRLVEVDANGREQRILGVEQSVSGRPVQLTIDLDLQRAAEQALNNRRGAVVVLNVNTGEVLALASGPTFDPNIFTRRVTNAEWDELQGENQPFLNRAVQGYPPGSTFKIVTAVAGMQSGTFNPTSILGTSAFITVGGTQFWEHSNQGYGAIGFREALAYSSNTFFYQVGMAAGPEAIAHWGSVLGVSTTPTMGLEGANPGIIPTPDQKEDLYGEPWYAGDTVSMAIGQGVVQVTPLELAVVVATVVNGGNRVIPHLAMSQTDTPEMQPIPTGIDPAALAVIREGLVATVQQGTAQRLNDGSIPLTGGKTGTSEVLGQESHSLFVGFGPANDPQIAIAAIVENGGYGSTNALPIAYEIYKVYFGR